MYHYQIDTFPGCTHLNRGVGYSYSVGIFGYAFKRYRPFRHWLGTMAAHVDPIAAAINGGYPPAVGRSFIAVLDADNILVGPVMEVLLKEAFVNSPTIHVVSRGRHCWCWCACSLLT